MVNNRDKLLGAINNPFLKATILECMQAYPADSVRWSDVYVKLKVIEHLSLIIDSRLQKIEQIPNKIDEVLKKHTADIKKSAKTTSYSVINSTIQNRLDEEVFKPAAETLSVGLGKAHGLVNDNYSSMTKLLKQDNIKKLLTIIFIALGIWGGFVWGRHDAKQTKYSQQFEQSSFDNKPAKPQKASTKQSTQEPPQAPTFERDMQACESTPALLLISMKGIGKEGQHVTIVAFRENSPNCKNGESEYVLEAGQKVCSSYVKIVKE